MEAQVGEELRVGCLAGILAIPGMRPACAPLGGVERGAHVVLREIEDGVFGLSGADLEEDCDASKAILRHAPA